MIPTLTTKRLLLRPFELRDAQSVQQLAGDHSVADTTLNVPYPYADGIAEQWIESHAAAFLNQTSVTLAIILLATSELVGAISLAIQRNADMAVLGYWIGHPYWGYGYCTEAAHAIVDYGFNQLGLNRIHATHFSRNPASGRVMEKLGMVREGLLRQHVKKWGQYEDIVEYGLLKHDSRVDKDTL